MRSKYFNGNLKCERLHNNIIKSHQREIMTYEHQTIEEKPSATALKVTIARALANAEFGDHKSLGADYLANSFIPAELKKEKLTRKIAIERKKKWPSGIYEYLLARTAYFDSKFIEALKSKTSQIILIGAGYDSRAYRYAYLNQGSQIFEVDTIATQKRKLEYLKSENIKIPDNVAFIPVNLDKESLKTALEISGYDSQKNTLFSWEGTTYYLSHRSVASTLEFVQNHAHPNSQIVFDYASFSPKPEDDDSHATNGIAKTMTEKFPDEQILFAIEEGKIDSFLLRVGFKVVEYLDNKEIESRFLVNKDGSLIGQINSIFRFVTASPNIQNSK